MKPNSSKTGKADGQTNGSTRFLPVTVRLLLDKSRFQSQNEAIKETVRLVERIGQIAEINFEPDTDICRVCGWMHDPRFIKIKIKDRKISLDGGVLSKIVGVVHRAHENGQNGLSTKNEELKKICDGYQNPCKAFDDKNHRDDYKVLFYTRNRGAISLRGAIGMESE
jgi:hypothetical protein